MKLWVVNHPHRYRRWLKVEVRELERGWRERFIWSEWFEPPPRGFEFCVPTVPAKQLTGANIDPLVIGSHMYFDYCRKRTGPAGRRKNNEARNELGRGDLILFGCLNQADVIIDTIFVVGETKQWGPMGVPPWAGLDLLAKRVHFHPDAHGDEQHSEVHQDDPVAARSYQGEPQQPGRDMFCWVPCRDDPPSRTTRPLVLPKKSDAYKLLTNIYARGGKKKSDVIEDGMKASFSVLHDVNDAPALFSALLVEARSRGFGIAIEMRLLSEASRAHDGSMRGPCESPGEAHAKGAC